MRIINNLDLIVSNINFNLLFHELQYCWCHHNYALDQGTFTREKLLNARMYDHKKSESATMTDLCKDRLIGIDI